MVEVTRVVMVCVTVKKVRAKEGVMRVAELCKRSLDVEPLSASLFAGLSLPSSLAASPPGSLPSEGVLAAGASLVLPVASLMATGSDGATEEEADPSMSEVHAVLSVLLWELFPAVSASDVRLERPPELGPSVAEAVVEL